MAGSSAGATCWRSSSPPPSSVEKKPCHPKKLDPAIMTQFTGSETFQRYGFAGDVLVTESVKYVADAAGTCRLLDII
jgi:hypothetical protein